MYTLLTLLCQPQLTLADHKRKLLLVNLALDGHKHASIITHTVPYIARITQQPTKAQGLTYH